MLFTAYGLWQLTGPGGTGWITIVVLVIGVMDLLGGLMMLSLSRAAAQHEGPPAGWVVGLDRGGHGPGPAYQQVVTGQVVP